MNLLGTHVATVLVPALSTRLDRVVSFLMQEQWIRGQPVVVTNVSERLKVKELWSPAAFSEKFGHLRHDIINTR